MSTSISHQIQELQARITKADEEIAGLESKLRAMDGELAGHLKQRAQYQLLEEICAPLEKLGGMGAADLFWGVTGHDTEKHLQRVRGIVAAFRQKNAEVEQQRNVLQTDIQERQEHVRDLNRQLADLQTKAEYLRIAFKGRQALLPYRIAEMPWTLRSSDEKRFRIIIGVILGFTIAFGGLVPVFKQPVEVDKGVVVPERLAQIIKKKKEAKLQKQKRQEKAEEKIDENAEKKSAENIAEKEPEKEPEKTPEKLPEEVDEKSSGKQSEKVSEKVAGEAKPETAKPQSPEQEAQAARQVAETKGVLAFKNDLSSLLNDSPTAKMGAEAHISISANQANGNALQRSLIVAQNTGSSGGINAGALNRQVEGGGGQRIAAADIKFTHVESAVGSAGSDRALGKGPASRTDEEIQIVFDRYKSALYRIYNRELRNDPTLRGKIVLRIVIEPDGHVSSCTVKSTDLPALSAEIVDRVLKFNFGPKEGATTITILYPIEFLPAN